MIRKFALWASLTVVVGEAVLLTAAAIHRRWHTDCKHYNPDIPTPGPVDPGGDDPSLPPASATGKPEECR